MSKPFVAFAMIQAFQTIIILIYLPLNFILSSLSSKKRHPQKISKPNDADNKNRSLRAGFQEQILYINSEFEKKTNSRLLERKTIGGNGQLKFSENEIRDYRRIGDSSVAKIRSILQQFCSNDTNPMWNEIHKRDDLYRVKIFKHKKHTHCYISDGYIPSLPGSTFDLLNDATNRPKWDSLIDSSEIIGPVSSRSRVLYTRFKPVWPISARDSLLLTSFNRLSNSEWPEVFPNNESKYRYYSVSTSVTHPNYPEFKEKGLVRMSVITSGYFIDDVPQSSLEELKLDSSLKWSRLIQVAHVKVDSWIPGSVVNIGKISN
ncbi:hypothetical protein AYI68_g393 [Smittium mucronatum]|uniref:START domain-containing protein n=1 Tax=Smittium mucronatum TaxID=133383 RepID=A0A1R0H8B0_9FUNG|nr:hypothetical protein AYI68_g393 [Smittium mucronatum]